jgi:uncharacterized protein YbbC (DUF1343 family)
MLSFSKFFFGACLLVICQFSFAQKKDVNPQIITGAERTAEYFPYLKGKKIALLVNQTSTISKTHLVDSLLKFKIEIVKIFAPEHGFRGNADAGEHVKSTIDKKTGLPIVSLYGKKSKPSSEDLKGVQIMLFDIQDVGCRFYTFISSLHYLMEACVENNIELLILDRPNPNGFYVDGPVLKSAFQSFVGVDAIPVVHGLTVGEYAQMVRGENWIANAEKLKLKIIKCAYYDHTKTYKLPIKPSPNLPNSRAIFLYPSLCFFEGTNISVGRGTNAPFQMIGSPYQATDTAFSFTPKPLAGATSPPFKGQRCYGYDLRKNSKKIPDDSNHINWNYVKKMYDSFSAKDSFFLKNNFFDKLAGNDTIRELIKTGTAETIRVSYQEELNNYKKIRKKYLLYKDFE